MCIQRNFIHRLRAPANFYLHNLCLKEGFGQNGQRERLLILTCSMMCID